MKWSIPAKTFLLGEYAAIVGAPALVLTTSPCFEMWLSDEPGLHDIHPESPAGQWWAQHGLSDKGLHWHDPYRGRGGMGASSAQFVGAYLATHGSQTIAHTPEELLSAYLQCAWQGQGLRPSGYDVLAQTLHGCVYLHREQGQYQSCAWAFHDLAFIVMHTGKKLATHEHLQTTVLPSHLDQLIATVQCGKAAMDALDSSQMIHAVNTYHQQLMRMNKVAEHSVQCIESLSAQPSVLAIKGCGAMGADVLLLLVPVQELVSCVHRFTGQGWDILATSDDLYVNQA